MTESGPLTLAGPLPQRTMAWPLRSSWQWARRWTAGAMTVLALAALLHVAGGRHAALAQEAGPAPDPPKESHDPLAPPERPGEDELVLRITLGRHVLSDATLAYLRRGGVLLALGELTAALDFPITVNVATGQAEGWFLREDRRFFLDVARGEVVVEGHRQTVDPRMLELRPDDIYVHSLLLSEWFPVDLTVELSRSRVTVRSREPLPVEQRLMREQLYEGLAGRGMQDRPLYPRHDEPYGLMSWPFADISFQSDYRRDHPEGEPVRETRDARYTTHIANDLLFMNMNLFVAGNDKKSPSDVRITLGRKDPDGKLVGPLSLTEYTLGDVFTPILPLVSEQREGRGLQVSSFPLGQPTGFDRTTLRGDLPLGWTVELYRNEVLLDGGRSRDDGRYEFTNVPLVFGLNVFRIVFYGPQGQRREDVQRFFIGPGLTPSGALRYRLAYAEQNRRTIRVEDDTAPFPTDTAAREPPQARVFAGFEWGLSERLGLSVDAARIPLGEIQRSYAGLGLRTTALGSSIRLDGVQDVTSDDALAKETNPLFKPDDDKDPNRTAYQLSLQTELFGIGLMLEQAWFDGFVSEQVMADLDPLIRRSALRLDYTIPKWLLPPVFISLEARADRHRSDEIDATLSNRLGIFVSQTSVSNSVEYELRGPRDDLKTLSAKGTFLVNYWLGRVQLRGQADYRIQPESDPSAASATVDYSLGRNDSVRVTLERVLESDPQTTNTTVAYLRLFKALSLGASMSYSSQKTFTAGLSLSTGFGRDPHSGDLVVRRDITESGTASARVFLDSNRNGVFDGTDEPLPSVGFRGLRDQQTDEEGIAFLTHLGTHVLTPISIDRGSLEDPFWSPVQRGVEIVPRPGVPTELAFPIVLTGEVDGTVFLRRGEIDKEVSNVRMQLVTPGGEVVRETRTEFDGFYLFDFVPAGHYRVRVSPEQVKQLNLVPPPEQDVVIENDGNVLNGVDFHLKRQGGSG